MALIHDDIIDEADKRHNASTMHMYIESLLKEAENRHHVAEGQAILVGDLILSWVYELRYKIK
jgi:geranylgeranyl pyrophosphate synthase